MMEKTFLTDVRRNISGCLVGKKITKLLFLFFLIFFLRVLSVSVFFSCIASRGPTLELLLSEQQLKNKQINKSRAADWRGLSRLQGSLLRPFLIVAAARAGKQSC